MIQMRGIVLGLIAVLLTGGAAHGQLRPFGDVFAIVGAKIEIGDGRVIDKGTVLVRDGLIEAVGAGIAKLRCCATLA